jgi:DNA-binding MarR family transcriptional regulator
VWLTDAGRARLVEEQEVLSKSALERAFTRMTAEERAQLLAGTRALIRAARATNKKEK